MDCFISDYNIKYYNHKIVISYYFYDGFVEDAIINKFQTLNLIREGFIKKKLKKNKVKTVNSV
jgi:hypothetical protein